MGKRDKVLGITRISMSTCLCFMQAHVKTEYVATIFSYCSLTSRSPLEKKSLAL